MQRTTVYLHEDQPAIPFLMVGLPILLAFGVFANTITDTVVYDDVQRFGQLSDSAPPVASLLRQPRGLS